MSVASDTSPFAADALAGLAPRRLIEIIQTQTEIAKLGADLGGVMALIAERSQILTDADGAAIELAEGEEMVYRASSGIARNQLGLRLRRNESLSGLCVAAGQALCCDDSEEDARVDRQACRRVGLRSMIVTPLKHAGTVVGVLKVMSKRVAVFRREELLVLELMSELIAAATYHAARLETSELFHRATHDPLTGLGNRALFHDRLRHHLARARRDQQRFAVINIDMDGLKAINDGRGHRCGDAAIRAVAERIKSQSRESDSLARMGGDEFALLATTLAGGNDLLLLMERIERAIDAQFHFEGQALHLGASLGAAIFPDDAIELEALLERADQAMYRVKRTRQSARRCAV